MFFVLWPHECKLSTGSTRGGSNPGRARGKDISTNRRQVTIVDDTDLEQLSIAELEALKANIENAVRAIIRAKRLAKMPLPPPETVQPKPPVNDLESARDAWLDSKRQGRAG